MVSKRRANHALQWAKKRLGLDDWNVHLTWSDKWIWMGEEFHGDANDLGQTICEPQRPEAHIFVGLAAHTKNRRPITNDVYQPIQTLFHELLHVEAHKMEIETPGVECPRRYEQSRNTFADILFDFYCLETGYAKETACETEETVSKKGAAGKATRQGRSRNNGQD